MTSFQQIYCQVRMVNAVKHHAIHDYVVLCSILDLVSVPTVQTS